MGNAKSDKKASRKPPDLPGISDEETRRSTKKELDDFARGLSIRKRTSLKAPPPVVRKIPAPEIKTFETDDPKIRSSGFRFDDDSLDNILLTQSELDVFKIPSRMMNPVQLADVSSAVAVPDREIANHWRNLPEGLTLAAAKKRFTEGGEDAAAAYVQHQARPLTSNAFEAPNRAADHAGERPGRFSPYGGPSLGSALRIATSRGARFSKGAMLQYLLYHFLKSDQIKDSSHTGFSPDVIWQLAKTGSTTGALAQNSLISMTRHIVYLASRHAAIFNVTVRGSKVDLRLYGEKSGYAAYAVNGITQLKPGVYFSAQFPRVGSNQNDSEMKSIAPTGQGFFTTLNRGYQNEIAFANFGIDTDPNLDLRGNHAVIFILSPSFYNERSKSEFLAAVVAKMAEAVEDSVRMYLIRDLEEMIENVTDNLLDSILQFAWEGIKRMIPGVGMKESIDDIKILYQTMQIAAGGKGNHSGDINAAARMVTPVVLNIVLGQLAKYGMKAVSKGTAKLTKLGEQKLKQRRQNQEAANVGEAPKFDTGKQEASARSTEGAQSKGIEDSGTSNTSTQDGSTASKGQSKAVDQPSGARSKTTSHQKRKPRDTQEESQDPSRKPKQRADDQDTDRAATDNKQNESDLDPAKRAQDEGNAHRDTRAIDQGSKGYVRRGDPKQGQQRRRAKKEAAKPRPRPLTRRRLDAEQKKRLENVDASLQQKGRDIEDLTLGKTFDEVVEDFGGDTDDALTALEQVSKGLLIADHINETTQQASHPSRAPSGVPTEPWLVSAIKIAHDAGVNGGRRQAAADGIDIRSDWKNPEGFIGKYGKGLDDVGTNTASGNPVIVEYKGNNSKLNKGQMQARWVGEKLAELEMLNDDLVPDLKSAAKQGKLEGRVYTTKVGDDANLTTEMTRDFGTYDPEEIAAGYKARAKKLKIPIDW